MNERIFISYRRSASQHLAHLIRNELSNRNLDAFLDVRNIGGGNFDEIILREIAARDQFILVLSRGTLDRCTNPDDFLRLEIEEAMRLNRHIVPIWEDGFELDAIEKCLPIELSKPLSKKNRLFYMPQFSPEFFEKLCKDFLLLDGAVELTTTQLAPNPTLQVTQVTPEATTSSTNLRLLSNTFRWQKIPAGNVTFGGKTVHLKEYSISRYPITNEDYLRFLVANGYERQEFWTSEGWELVVSNKWKKPRYWSYYGKALPIHPVVGISWHEAMAFSTWLSKETNQNVSLPTEFQWVRAARGASIQRYVWGNIWRDNSCNSKEPFGESDGTTPVKLFEKTNVSSFEVVDLCGNVWEWCSVPSDKKALHGGSWNDYKKECTITARIIEKPEKRTDNAGFRVVMH